MKKPIFSNEEVKVQNKYWTVIQKDFVDSQNRKWNVITMKSSKQGWWTLILALTQDNKIILNKDYKFWPDDFMYTLPWWFVEKWLLPSENIKKELEEETWFSTDSEIISLWKTMQNWYISWYNELFFTKDCYKIWDTKTHEWEEIKNYLVSIEEFEKMLLNNEILDPYSEVCFYRVKNLNLLK